MIRVTALTNKEYLLNADHIEKIEEVPETVITLINGKVYLVKESIDEILNRYYEYKKKTFEIIRKS